MRIRKVLRKPITIDEDGLQVSGGIHAVISANVNEPGNTSATSSQRVRIVQRAGKSRVETDPGNTTKEVEGNE